MSKVRRLKKSLYTVTALTLGFGPFVTASGQSFEETPVQTPGRAFAVDNLKGICVQNTSEDPSLAIACTFALGGINDITAQNLSPQAAIQAESIAITSPYQFIRSTNESIQRLTGRSAEKRQQQSSFLLQSSASVAGTPSFGTSGFIGPVGVSLSGGGSFGERNTAEGQTGFQLNTRQTSLMIDYSFNQKLIGGFSFNYLGTDRNLRLASGDLNSDSYRFAPFVLFRPTTNSYLTLMGGYALVNYRSTRSVSSQNDITFDNATANYDANQFFASVGGGYTFTLMDGWNLRGYGRGDFSDISIQSFQEKGGVAHSGNDSLSLAMSVNKQTIRSVTSTLGVELSHAISTRTFIPVIIPRLRAEWVHEFENNARTITAGFTGQNYSPTSASMAVASSVRNWANLGVGVQMLFARSIIGYINYDRLIIKHAENNIISGGIRMNF